MKLPHRTESAAVGETESARRFRYLLRATPAPTMTSVVATALERLPSEDREALLVTIREQFLAGQRTSADAFDDVARLAILGERRSPGALLGHLPEGVRERLADAVLRVPAAASLLEGYAAWDGADPPPVNKDEPYDPFTKHLGGGENQYNIVKGRAEGGFST
jgi:hypothetical protein